MHPLKNGRMTACCICGTSIYRRKSQVSNSGNVYCSRVCSGKRIRSQNERDKISAALRIVPITIKNCLHCNKSFDDYTNKKTLKFCNKICATEHRKGFKHSNNTKNKMRLTALKQIASGTRSGWSSRKKMKPSFPEELAIEILDIAQINYEREHKVGKWFIDFALHDSKIALEIDGKQHELPDRKASDALKDSYLVSQGWNVIRIKWLGIKQKTLFVDDIKKNIGQ